MMKATSHTHPTGEQGFTLIELILVIVMIGLLASIAAQKLIQVAEDVEITAEDATIETMRKNIFSNFSERLIKGQAAIFALNPFNNLSKVPEGYSRRRTTKPTGNPVDDGIWVYIQGSTTGGLSTEEAGTTLSTFQTSGFIYHQRRDHTIIKWAYDQINGIISNKIIDRESQLKRQLDIQRNLRGEETERNRLRRKQPATGVRPIS